MSHKERVFHSVLFELFALIILTTLAMFFTGNDMGKIAGLAVVMSLTAMGWNYVYNLIYDKVFGGDRSNRTFTKRLVHGLGFELGLLVLTLPMLMWALQLDFWTVLIMDIGLVVFFVLYAIGFNWAYDIVRQRIVTPIPS